MEKDELVDHLRCRTKIILGEKDPIILLHGWGQTYHFWDDLILFLAKKGFSIYALDLPGFGYSEEPSEVWHIKDYAVFLQKFLKIHYINKPIIIGHSFGGRIAAYYASKYPTKKLILYSSSGINHIALPFLLFSFFVKILQEVIPIQVYQFQSWIFKSKKYKNEYYINSTRAKRMIDIYFIHFESFEDQIKTITAPTLILSGKYDFIVSPYIGKRLHQMINASEYEIIPKSTHFAHIENKPYFIKTLYNFLLEPTPVGSKTKCNTRRYN